MKEWLVDTNVLLDVLGADERFGLLSKEVLGECAETGILVINPIIFAEVGAWLQSLEELDALLPEELFRRDPLPWEGAFLAGQAFTRYKRAGGEKRRILADFMIGAHAALAGFVLISRDSGIGRYFDIQILNPGEFPGPQTGSEM
jgi:hypothetical protein